MSDRELLKVEHVHAWFIFNTNQIKIDLCISGFGDIIFIYYYNSPFKSKRLITEVGIVWRQL